uniref:E3 ubiquitin protein ligase n=1 Tax=Kalanchoe fedtschenkoi TaxID=63787 RepID=A0A7N0UII9_KALFE
MLKYQNQKLHQKLETQKVEHVSLSHKLSSFKERQHQYDGSLSVVNKSWKEFSILFLSFKSQLFIHRHSSTWKVVLSMKIWFVKSNSSLLKHAFLRRLSETGATGSSSTNSCSEQMEVDPEAVGHKLRNVTAAIDNRWCFKDEVSSICSKAIKEDGRCCQKISTDLVMEVTNLRKILCDLHVRHRSLGIEMHNLRGLDAKNKADFKRLQNTVKELEDINFKVASLQAEGDATKGAFIPLLDMISKHVYGDRARDKQKDLQDMESMLKELMVPYTISITELKNLHEERIRVLKKLTSLQNTLKNLKCISSLQPYTLVHDQLAKSKVEVSYYQAMYEKLQNERDIIAWLKEVNLKNELVDVSRGFSSVDDHRAAELRIGIQKQIDRRNIINARLTEGIRDPGRKEIIAEFKAMALSFHKHTNSMQKQLNKHKDTASDVHSLHGARDENTAPSAAQADEIKKLLSVVDSLKVSESKLSLILEMCRRESAESRYIKEAKDLEYKSWAHIQSLNSSLDERTLESLVKKANEAEAASQDICNQSDILQYKKEENQSYMSETEVSILVISIGRAYDDMETLNRHLLQQITDMERELQISNSSFDFFVVKASRVEDQKLAEDKKHSSCALANSQKKLLDVSRSFQIKRIDESLEVARRKVLSLQAQIDGSSILMKLREEIREYQEILNCGVCPERPKEVVITKYFHLFCHPCIQRIVDCRHGKCLSSSASF